MAAFLSYTLQVAVVMILLYLGFKWLMASTTFHGLNRMALLGIILFSWAMPALIPILRSTPDAAIEVTLPPVELVIAEVANPAPPEIPVWPLVITSVYYIGVIVAFAFTLVGAIKMARLIRHGEATKTDNHIIVITPRAPGPMSWGRWIIMRPEDVTEGYDMILTHEKAHLSRFHWIDLMLAQLNAIVQWFNPAAWLIITELKNVHEYQADAVASSANPYEYQLMLLKKTVGPSFPTFADSLNHSQLKQRLTMMMKKKSRASRRLTALAIPAMAAVATVTLSIPSVADVVSEIRDMQIPVYSPDKVNNSLAESQISSSIASGASASNERTDEVTEEAITEQVTTVDSPASENEENNADLPEIKVVQFNSDTDQTSDNATQTKKNVNLPAYFVNGELYTGRLTDIPSSSIKAIQIIKNDPQYPDGKIMITLYQPGETPKDEKETSTPKGAVAVQQMAEFQGGQKELMDFLKQNIRMPKGVNLTKTERVIVKFIINTDGSLSDVTIVKKASEPALNDEAVRVVKLMSGKWKPATNDGTPIASYFTLPVSFSPQQ